MKSILTTYELKKYKNKIIVFSLLDKECKKEKSFMAKLINVNEKLLFEFNKHHPCTVTIGGISNIEPFFYCTYFNTIKCMDIYYAREPTQKELKKYKNKWTQMMYPQFFNGIMLLDCGID